MRRSARGAREGEGGFGSLFLVGNETAECGPGTLDASLHLLRGGLVRGPLPLRGRRDLSALHRAQIR